MNKYVQIMNLRITEAKTYIPVHAVHAEKFTWSFYLSLLVDSCSQSSLWLGFMDEDSGRVWNKIHSFASLSLVYVHVYIIWQIDSSTGVLKI